MDYKLLPFRFAHLGTEYFLTNEIGEFTYLSEKDFTDFVDHKLDTNCDVFLDLVSKQIATKEDVKDVVKMLAVKYRTKKSILKDFTSLHMVVPTLRCNSSCIYCQVARKNMDDHAADMTKKTAKNIVKTIFKSPSPYIKIEFQGGDPSTNFPMVKYIIKEAEKENILKEKNMEFIICTNITLLDEEMVRFLKRYDCQISTSLDGPEDLHNTNRPLQNTSYTHQLFEEKLEMVRRVWGNDGCVGALMTTSRFSLGHFRDIVDEYVRLKFNYIFFRALNPYGFAKQYKEKVAYPVEDFIENYKEGLDYIIELNKKGTFIVEGFAQLLLRRILTPYATGFVDLQSPAGVGIAGAIYDYDGSVYVADEGRMMARFKNYYFRLGNVNSDSYNTMFNGDKLHHIIDNACTECLPMCSECAFQPYCGADPVRNLSEQGDLVGHRPTNEMCKKTKSIIQYLLNILRTDSEAEDVFWSWLR